MVVASGIVAETTFHDTVFTIKNDEVNTNTYVVEQLTFSDQGTVDIVASEYPCNDDGSSRIVEALLDGSTRFGAEGVTLDGDTLWVAIQREWEDDAKGIVKLLAYKPDSKEWSAVRYPLESTDKGWVGLSEITASGDWLYVLERDNQIGDAARLKKLYRVAKADLKPAPLGGDLPTVTKEEVHDFLSDLKATGGYVVDKIEGFTIASDGTAYAVTDNDGVDDSSGETLFFSIGKL